MADLPPGPWRKSLMRPLSEPDFTAFVDVNDADGNPIAGALFPEVAELLIEARAERDETIADVKWLESLSPRNGGSMSMLAVRLCDDGLHLMAPGPREGIEGLKDYVSPHVATRGAVRKYLWSLGVEFDEGITLPAGGKE